jgi:hypothetical protein
LLRLIYLVQGEARLVESYFHLNDRQGADAIFMTFDREIDGAVYFPNSRWSEGRNRLLELACARGDYDYYIFADDDVEFIRGGWTEFEEDLARFRPAIGVPIVPKTAVSPLRGLRAQAFPINDEQLMAFHRSVVGDHLLIPHQSQFDPVHQWATCEIQEILIQTFYARASLQLNRCEIANVCHDRRPMDEAAVEPARRMIREWLANELPGGFRDISTTRQRERRRILLASLWARARVAMRKRAGYALSEKALARVRVDGVLWKQLTPRAR